MNLVDLVISTDFRKLTEEDVPKSCQTRSPLGFSHRSEKPQVFKGNTQAYNFMRSQSTWKMMGHVTEEFGFL